MLPNIDKMGFGRHFEDLTVDNLKAFLFDLVKFSDNLQHYYQNGNEVLFGLLNEKLSEYENK